MTDAAEELFRELLPGIDQNVRNHAMLVPCLVVQTADRRRFLISVDAFFQDQGPRKDLVLPLVGVLFTNPDVVLVALISECWIAELRTDEARQDWEKVSAAGGGVKDLPERIDGVMVQVYSRDGEDRSFQLAIRDGRAGVEVRSPKKGETWDHAEGRFIRRDHRKN